ncbi:methylated-DNA--[protein]-cysteine S-methyltransferase [Marivirga salinae]|uniref:methylated-DNA--[protein]-cysteine S-methyltransferase n=1 Tax=Marivirga salinarum TaxID=3059078 RepID=A0AA51NDZ1_9BACT|nr:methylated-DNA--[protein]-cysteine S-methyltransferase [Marivirga sp. BDSF4-3]WMN12085.1 methylated-DNA--[protein]-cysteine S-methyltransferase [Marivirga sp. BDSF4-3]
MEVENHFDYKRIEQAISYIRTHFKNRPNLEEVAEHVHLSPYHFQRIFKKWAGVSPKKFMQYLSTSYAKKILKQNEVSVAETAYEIGLSGTGRLHDLFINIEGMTPGEYKNGARQIAINYSFAKSPFGDILVASTTKGICHLAFFNDHTEAFEQLQLEFPNAIFKQAKDQHQDNALLIFNNDWSQIDKIKLHLKGTPFQLKVWETLIKIPSGNLSTYGKIANEIDHPNASRAVGTAISENPIAILIPCHRVIRATGDFGEYRWGKHRKSVIIGREAAQKNYLR